MQTRSTFTFVECAARPASMAVDNGIPLGTFASVCVEYGTSEQICFPDRCCRGGAAEQNSGLSTRQGPSSG